MSLNNPETITCPQCSFKQEVSPVCEKCGLIFEKYKKAIIKDEHYVYPGKVQISKSWLWKPVKILLVVAGIIFLLFVIFKDLFILPHPPSYDSQAQYNLKSSMTAQEAFFADNGSYTESVEAIAGNEYGFFPTEGVTVSILSADRDHYQILSFHEKGNNGFLVDGPVGSIEKIDKSEAISLARESDESKGTRVETLFTGLKSMDPEARAHAAEGLGLINSEKAVIPLIEALKDESDSVRWHATRALGMLGDKRAVQPLIECLDDKDKDVIRGARDSLSKIMDHREYNELIREKRPLSGLITIERLMNDLKSRYPGVRDSAASSLKRMKDPRAVQALIKALGDEEWTVRRTASRSLGEITGIHSKSQVVEALILTLDDDNRAVQWEVAHSLNKITGKNFGIFSSKWKVWWEKENNR
jgi:hypothetical protein